MGHAVKIQRREHFGVYGPLYAELVIRAVEPVAPGFLAEYALVLEHARIQAAVGIEICVFQKLGLREARHRVCGVELAGLSVEVRVVGLVHEIEKDILGRIFSRTAQRRVLEHMRQTRVVDCFGKKCEIESAVDVLIGNIQESRAGLFVLKEHGCRADRRDIPYFFDAETFNNISDRRQSSVFRRSGKCRERQDHAYCNNNDNSFFHFTPHNIARGYMVSFWPSFRMPCALSPFHFSISSTVTPKRGAMLLSFSPW